MTNKELFEEVAKETGYDPTLVEFVYNHLFTSIRRILSRPLICKKGLKLEEFGKFFIKPAGIRSRIFNVKSDHKKEFYKALHYVITGEEYDWDKFINEKLVNHEGQTEKDDNHAGCSGKHKTGREEE